MIKSKKDLKIYIEMDGKVLGVNPRKYYWYGKQLLNFEKF